MCPGYLKKIDLRFWNTIDGANGRIWDVKAELQWNVC